MVDKIRNYNAIYQFVEHWREEGVMYVNSVGNTSCEALVSYSSITRGDVTFRTNVRIIRNGYEDGKISLEELEDYPAEEYHLDFSADFQDIRFHHKAKSLVVKGESGKMGKYQVHLAPIR